MGIFSFLMSMSTSNPVSADTQNIVVIDVRTAEEYADTHVVDTLNIDFLKSDFTAIISKLDKEKTYKLYCRSGNRSGQAERLMKTLGFKNVENIGSVSEAAQTLNRQCDGKSSC